MSRSSKLPFHLLALAVSGVWGVTFVSTRALILAGMHPVAIFILRFTLAYIGIWFFSREADGKFRLWSRNWKDELVFVFLGITGGSVYFLAENNALAHTQAPNVSFIVCSAPLYTALATLLYKRLFKGRFADGLEPVRVGWPLIGGTVLALVGMALVVFDGAKLQLSAAGDLLALGAALCWALYSLYMSQLTEDYGAIFATRKVFFYGLVTILPFLGSCGSSFSWALLSQPVVYLNLLFLGLVASLAGYFGWNLAMAKLGNVTSTNYIYLNPVFTIVFAFLFLGEQLSLTAALGCAAIMAGVIWAGRS